jgi:hypothetical protein
MTTGSRGAGGDTAADSSGKTGIPQVGERSEQAPAATETEPAGLGDGCSLSQ